MSESNAFLTDDVNDQMLDLAEKEADRYEYAEWIATTLDLLTNGAGVLKHWTEYGPNYVGRLAKMGADRSRIEKAVSLLGWHEDSWGFPPLEQVIGS